MENQIPKQTPAEALVPPVIYDQDHPAFMENPWLKISSEQVAVEQNPTVAAEVFSAEHSPGKIARFFRDSWDEAVREMRRPNKIKRPARQNINKHPLEVSPTEIIQMIGYNVASLAPVRVIGMEALRGFLNIALLKPEYRKYGVPPIDNWKSSRNFRRPNMAGGNLHALYEKTDAHIRRFDANVHSPVMQKKLRQYPNHPDVAKILRQTRTRQAS